MLPATKREIITMAYEDLALAGYEFDLTAEEYASAHRRMQFMVAGWAQRGAGVRLSDGGLDDMSGIPVGLVEGVAANLAMRIASSKGKTVAPDTRAVAGAARDQIFATAAMPTADTQSGFMPRGAGNRGPGGSASVAPFFPAPYFDPLENIV